MPGSENRQGVEKVPIQRDMEFYGTERTNVCKKTETTGLGFALSTIRDG